MAYIQGPPSPQPESDAPLEFLPGADPACFLCRAVAARADRANLVVHRGPRSMVVLNRYPYNNGHLLIAPLEHRARLDEVDAATHAEALALIGRLVTLLEKLIRAEGFNLGLNLGRVAGAGLPGHLHWHLVPRWTGDTNFMPVLGDTSVISQSLDALWEMLVAALDASPS
jgi:ATP adenylyltransferase